MHASGHRWISSAYFTERTQAAIDKFSPDHYETTLLAELRNTPQPILIALDIFRVSK